MVDDENHWVRYLRAHTSPSSRGVTVGIGDDAAVLDPSGLGQLVFCSDQTLEGVHFTRDEGLWWAGRKALCRSLSDLAAMAARPWTALLSLSVPPGLTSREMEELFRGVLDTAKQEEIALVGGDLASTPGGIALDVCALGGLEGRAPWLRSGASPGDSLWVTGPLGGSREGHHLRFRPRWREALELARSGAVHACIDLSDGLARDLPRMLEASGVGARIERDSVPCRVLSDGRAVAFEAAWGDGEDFELLLAVRPGGELSIEALRSSALDLRKIGTVVANELVIVDANGSVTSNPGGGYEHRGSNRSSDRRP